MRPASRITVQNGMFFQIYAPMLQASPIQWSFR